MSLNKFADPAYTMPKPWMNIRCNTVSFGDSIGQIKTQAVGSGAVVSNGTVTNAGLTYYTCDHTSLRMVGNCSYTSDTASHNTFTLDVLIPGELQSRFQLGNNVSVECQGYTVENFTNTLFTTGLVANSTVISGGYVRMTFHYNADVTTATTFRAHYVANIFHQG